MSTIYGLHLTYETLIGLSAYATMGIFFVSSVIVLDWSEIKHDIPAFDKVFGAKGVVSEEAAFICFCILLVSAWVGFAVLADFMFM